MTKTLQRQKRIYTKSKLTNKRGIYRITNKVNSKFYIGSTINLGRRWWEHKKFLKLKIHCNGYLQSAWNKYGKDNFTFSVVETLPDSFSVEQILFVEQGHLDKFYDGGKNCYNLAKIADRPDCDLNRIPVNQIDKSTNEIIKTWSSTQEALDTLGLHGITTCCRGVQSSSGGYFWKYADETLAAQFKEKRSPHGGRGKKEIYQLDLYGNILEVFSSIENAVNKTKIIRTQISFVCNKRRQLANGYKFCFKQDLEETMKELQKTNTVSTTLNEGSLNTMIKLFSCVLCNSNVSFKLGKALATHIQIAHKMSSKEYTIKTVYNSQEPGCKECGKATRYVGFSFKDYCKAHIKLACAKGGRLGGKASKKTMNTLVDTSFQAYLNQLPKELVDATELEFMELSKVKDHEKQKQHRVVMEQALLDNKKYMMFYSDEWKDKEALVRSMVGHRLGSTVLKMDARKLVTKEITDKSKVKEFFNKSHISGGVPSKVCFGLCDKQDNIVCAITLRKPVQVKKYGAGTYEVARFASAPGVLVRGGFSKLLSKVVSWCRQNNVIKLISYAELRFGEGKVYEKNGFVLKQKNTGENYWYTDGAKRYFRFKFRAQKNPKKTEKQVAAENNVFKVYGCGNSLYELNI